MVLSRNFVMRVRICLRVCAYVCVCVLPCFSLGVLRDAFNHHFLDKVVVSRIFL